MALVELCHSDGHTSAARHLDEAEQRYTINGVLDPSGAALVRRRRKLIEKLVELRAG